MKRILYLSIILGLLSACNHNTPQNTQNAPQAAPQNTISIDEVFDTWTDHELQCKDDDIVSLVKTFNDAMPTYSGTTFLNDANLPEDEREYLTDVDREHGYARFAEGSDDESAEDLCARLWTRSDGTKLFAIRFDQPSSNQQCFALFYDYDPTTGKLTPTKCPIDDFKTSFGNSLYSISLPEEGDDIVIHEYFMNWWMGLDHTYHWNGKYFETPTTTIDNMEVMMAQYKDVAWLDDDDPFTQYCLYDFDDDGEPELWLSSDSEEYQAIYSIVEESVFLAGSSDYKRHLIFYPGVIGEAGGCGTGCYLASYVVLENSSPKLSLNDLQLYNFEKDDVDHEYDIDGNPVSEEEALNLKESFGQYIEITPDWRPL